MQIVEYFFFPSKGLKLKGKDHKEKAQRSEEMGIINGEGNVN